MMENFNGTLYATTIKEARQLVRKSNFVEVVTVMGDDTVLIETTKAAALRSLEDLPAEMFAKVRLFTMNDGRTICTLG